MIYQASGEFFHNITIEKAELKTNVNIFPFLPFT